MANIFGNDGVASVGGVAVDTIAQLVSQFAVDETGSSGRVVAITGGNTLNATPAVIAVVAASFTIPANTSRYISITAAGALVMEATVGAGNLAIWQFTANATSITQAVDMRYNFSQIPTVAAFLTTGGVAYISAAITAGATASAAAAAASAVTATTQAGIATTQAGLATADVALTHADVVLTHADVVSTAANLAATVAALAAAGIPTPVTALNMLRVNAGATAYELRTPAQVLADIGASGLATLNTFIRNGDQFLLSKDVSKFRTGTWSDPTVLSGDMYTLLGELCMQYWSDNVALDAAGNFLGRDNADACFLSVFTESGLAKTYYAVTAAAGVVPAWVLKSTISMATGTEVSTGNLTKTGTITSSDTTDATSSTAAAMKTAGGLAVAKKLFVGTLLDLSTAAAGQIKFPATQNASADANTLDDYEEGTWTPSPTNVTVVGTPTYTGTYTKIGRKVTCQLHASATTSVAFMASSTTFTGLPFTASSMNGAGASVGSGHVTGGVGLVYTATFYSGTVSAASFISSTLTYEV